MIARALLLGSLLCLVVPASAMAGTDVGASDRTLRASRQAPFCQCNTPGFCETSVGAGCVNLGCFYPAAVGQSCNDGNPNTTNDACTSLKKCVGVPIPTATIAAPTAQSTNTPPATETPTPTSTPTATIDPSNSPTATETSRPTAT